MPIHRANGLILALDVEEGERAVRTVSSASAHLDAVKVSLPGVLRPLLAGGMNIVTGIKRVYGGKVIADWKVADVPHTNVRIVHAASALGADAVIVHAVMGEDALLACVDAARENDMDIYAVVELSNPGAERFMMRIGEDLATLARGCGTTGIIAPATRPHRLRRYREILGSGMQILSPGVGAQGAEPGSAIRTGADLEIVGRAIYTAPDPAREAERLSALTRAALLERGA